MNVRALALSQRIDDLLATSDPFAVHESMSSYLDSLEESVLQKWLLSSIPALDEQSADAFRQELDERNSGASLEQMILQPRESHELANSVSRFFSRQPRAMSDFAPPLLTGYLAYIASLEGQAPRKKLNTRVLAGAGAVALGTLLFLHSLGTTNRAETPVSMAPVPLITSRAVPFKSTRGSSLPSKASRRGHRGTAIILRRIRKHKAVAHNSRKHHRQHYAGTPRNAAHGRVSANHRFRQRFRRLAAHHRSAHVAIAARPPPAPRPFHGIFKPFRWVLFKPVHRGPG